MKYIECGDSFKDIYKFDVGLLLQQIDRLNTYNSSIIPENFIDHKHESYSLKDHAVEFVPPEPESVLRFYEEFYKKYGDVCNEECEPD